MNEEIEAKIEEIPKLDIFKKLNNELTIYSSDLNSIRENLQNISNGLNNTNLINPSDLTSIKNSLQNISNGLNNPNLINPNNLKSIRETLQDISNDLSSNRQIETGDFNSIIVHLQNIRDSLNNNNQINPDDFDVITVHLQNIRDSLNNNNQINPGDFNSIRQRLLNIQDSLTNNNIQINQNDFNRIAQKINDIKNSLNRNNSINPDDFDVITVHLQNIQDSLNNNNIQINSEDFNSIRQRLLNIRDTLNNNPDRFKEFLEIYQIYRDHIKHEDILGNQRLSFFIASQSFLFFPYFNVLKEFEVNGYKTYDLLLLILICILGWITSWLTEATIRGFVDASSAIASIWKKKCLLNQQGQKDLRFKYYRYYNNRQVSNRDIRPINQLRDIIGDNNLSFLEIDNRTIPNIRFENPNGDLNKKIDKFSNRIPYWFMWIWFVLLAASVLFFWVKPFSSPSNESFSASIKQILIDNQKNSIDEISNIYQQGLDEKQNKIGLLEVQLEKKQQYLDKEKDNSTKKEQENKDLNNAIESNIRMLVINCENKIDSNTNDIESTVKKLKSNGNRLKNYINNCISDKTKDETRSELDN